MQRRNVASLPNNRTLSIHLKGQKYPKSRIIDVAPDSTQIRSSDGTSPVLDGNDPLFASELTFTEGKTLADGTTESSENVLLAIEPSSLSDVGGYPDESHEIYELSFAGLPNEITSLFELSDDKLSVQVKPEAVFDYETLAKFSDSSLNPNVEFANGVVKVTLALGTAGGSATTPVKFSFNVADRLDVTLADGTTNAFADQLIETDVSLMEGVLASSKPLFTFNQSTFEGSDLLNYLAATYSGPDPSEEVLNPGLLAALRGAFEIVAIGDNITLQTKADVVTEDGTTVKALLDYETLKNLADDVNVTEVSVSDNNNFVITLPTSSVTDASTFKFSIEVKDAIAFDGDGYSLPYSHDSTSGANIVATGLVFHEGVTVSAGTIATFDTTSTSITFPSDTNEAITDLFEIDNSTVRVKGTSINYEAFSALVDSNDVLTVTLDAIEVDSEGNKTSTPIAFTVTLGDKLDFTTYSTDEHGKPMVHHGFTDQVIDTGASVDEGNIATSTPLFAFGQSTFDREVIDLSYITEYTPADGDNLTLQDQFYLALQNAFEVIQLTDDDGNPIGPGIGLQTKAGGSIAFETLKTLADDVNFSAISFDSDGKLVINLPISSGDEVHNFHFSINVVEQLEVTTYPIDKDGNTVVTPGVVAGGIDTGATLTEGEIADSSTTLFDFGETTFAGEIIDLSYIKADATGLYKALYEAFEVKTTIYANGDTFYGLQTKAGGS